MSDVVNTGVSTNTVAPPTALSALMQRLSPQTQLDASQPSGQSASIPPYGSPSGSTPPSALSSLLQQLGGGNSGGSSQGTPSSLNSFLNQYLPGNGAGNGPLAPTGGAQDIKYLQALFGGQAAPGVLGSLLGSFGNGQAAGPMMDGSAGYATSSGLLGGIGDAASSIGDGIMGLFA